MSRGFSSVGQKLVSASVLRVGNLIGAAMAAFFLMPFVVHHLGDRIYGFWSLASAFIGYYNLLDLGLSSAISQYICIALGRNDQAQCRLVFNTALRLQSAIGGVALLATCAIALAAPLFWHNAADARLFSKVIAIFGVNAALGFPARVYGAVLQAQLRFDIDSWLANLGLALRTGLTVWVILAGGGLLALAQVTLWSTLPVTALQIWFGRREAPWARIQNMSTELKVVKNFFSYSLYSFLAYLADIARFQIDPLVISSFIGLVAVTHYKIAWVLVQYYMGILIVSVGMLLPLLSRLHGKGDEAGLDKVFLFGTKLSCCYAVFVCLALISWGKPFINRWMGRNYEDAYFPLIALSLAALLDLCQRASIDLLFATFKHRFYTYINWAEGVLNVIFSVALARRFGILGVAMGTLIGSVVVRVIVQPWWVCRVSGRSYLGYMSFLGKNVLRSGFLALAAIGICAWGLRPSYLWLISSAICTTAIYAAGCFWVVLDEKERELSLAALKRNEFSRQAEHEAAAPEVVVP